MILLIDIKFVSLVFLIFIWWKNNNFKLFSQIESSSGIELYRNVPQVIQKYIKTKKQHISMFQLSFHNIVFVCRYSKKHLTKPLNVDDAVIYDQELREHRLKTGCVKK
jgi:hypothetical protein